MPTPHPPQAVPLPPKGKAIGVEQANQASLKGKAVGVEQANQASLNGKAD